MIDINNTNRGYLLGRLYAVYAHAEKHYRQCGHRFYMVENSIEVAYRNPRIGFPRLHAYYVGFRMPKQEYENLLMEIYSKLTDIPTQLTSEEGGAFMVAVYHQQLDLDERSVAS
jgi:hypothetical protein